MQTLRFIASLGFAGMAAYIVWDIYGRYRAATGSTWERLLSSARDSATILWGKFCLILAGIVGNLDSIADMIGAPEAKDFINTWVGNPKVIAAIMLGISVISMTARKRTL